MRRRLRRQNTLETNQISAWFPNQMIFHLIIIKKSFNVRHSIPVYGNKSIEQKLSTISTLFSSWNAICFHFSLLYPYPKSFINIHPHSAQSSFPNSIHLHPSYFSSFWERLYRMYCLGIEKYRDELFNDCFSLWYSSKDILLLLYLLFYSKRCPFLLIAHTFVTRITKLEYKWSSPL